MHVYSLMIQLNAAQSGTHTLIYPFSREASGDATDLFQEELQASPCCR